MIDRISRAHILEITSVPAAGINSHDRDEMAIPTYLHSNPLIRWLMWKRYDRLANMLNGTTGNALEFGCGIGLFLPELHKHFENVYAIDLFPQYARQLCAHRGIDVEFLENLEQLEDTSLDVIVAADVLEHLEDLDNYLQLFQRKLKPGGKFLVSGPSESVIYKIGRFVAGFSGKGDYHHTNIYHLIDAIGESGFEKGRVIDLPLAYLPPLFRLCEFHKPG